MMIALPKDTRAKASVVVNPLDAHVFWSDQPAFIASNHTIFEIEFFF
jgi:hypothetical protein